MTWRTTVFTEAALWLIINSFSEGDDKSVLKNKQKQNKTGTKCDLRKAEVDQCLKYFFWGGGGSMLFPNA